MAVYDDQFSPEELKKLEERVQNIPEEEKAALRSGADKIQNGEGLNQQELNAYEKNLGIPAHTKSEGGQMSDKLNAGYKGDTKDEDKTSVSRRFNSNSAIKKKMAIASVAAGGSIVGGILLFFALLPLKIENLVMNIEGRFGAASESAIDKESSNALDKYMTKYVFPNLGRGACHSTVDAGCVSNIAGTSPVARMYKGWKQARLESTLATKYDLAFKKQGNSYFLVRHGSTVNIGNGSTMFGDAKTSLATRQDIRTAVRTSLADETLYKRVFYRFKIGRLLESKYGIRRCVIACKLRDKFADTRDTKLAAGKAYLVRRVVEPYNISMGLALECVISGSCDLDSNTSSSNVTDENDVERQSGFQRDLSQRLDQYASALGADALKDLVAKADQISQEGLTKYVFRDALNKALGKDITSDTMDKFYDPLGWVQFASQVVGFINNAKSSLSKLTYIMHATAAVSAYMTFRSAVDELHSGHTDSTEIGALSDQLSGNGIDGTKSPLYNSLFNGSSTTTASLFGSTVSAAGTQTATHLCSGGKDIPAGKQICPEEDFTASNILSDIIGGLQAIPGWSIISDAANLYNSTVGRIIGTITSWLGGLVNDIPGVATLEQAMVNFIQPLFNAFAKMILPNPLVDNTNSDGSGHALPSGARMTDLAIAGGDQTLNNACESIIGCKKVSDAVAGQIQTQYLQQQQDDFSQRPLYARLFSTDTQFSFVSKLSVAMPGSLTNAATDAGSFFTNPFNAISSSLGAFFAMPSAQADTSYSDSFHIDQYAHPTVPDDPEAYWDQNCQGDYETPWLNSQVENPDTGQSEALSENNCMLIKTMAESAGGKYDASLLPQSSSTASGGSSDISAYKNPYRDIHPIWPSRIDGGVDYGGGNGPIYAIGSGVVTMVKSGAGSGWPGNPGAYIQYKLSDGPAKGLSVYFAEDCFPTVSVNQQVTPDTKICDFRDTGTASEIGWSNGSGEYIDNDYDSHGGGNYASIAGQNMSALLVKLGNPAGVIQGTKSTAPLPAGLPTW